MTPTAVRAAAALGFVVLLAACGSSKASTGAAATKSNAAATTTANDNNAYRTCLSAHGVTLPNRGPRPTGTNDSAGDGATPAASAPPDSGPPSSVDAATQAAFQACASLRPANGFRGNGANSQAMQAYVSCLKDNGVQVAGTTASSGPPPSFDRSSPAFAAADAKCHVLLPERPARTTTTTTAAP